MRAQDEYRRAHSRAKGRLAKEQPQRFKELLKEELGRDLLVEHREPEAIKLAILAYLSDKPSGPLRPSYQAIGKVLDLSGESARKYVRVLEDEGRLERVERRDSDANRGENHAGSKLTEAAVRNIRQRHAAGEDVGKLAVENGVAVATVRNVLDGTRWSHV